MEQEIHLFQTQLFCRRFPTYCYFISVSILSSLSLALFLLFRFRSDISLVLIRLFSFRSYMSLALFLLFSFRSYMSLVLFLLFRFRYEISLVIFCQSRLWVYNSLVLFCLSRSWYVLLSQITSLILKMWKILKFYINCLRCKYILDIPTGTLTTKLERIRLQLSCYCRVI